MLTKMGYKQGESIGRSSSGIVEPISIQLKTDRGGLGRAAAIKQLEEYKEKLRQARSEKKTEDATNSISLFRQRMAERTSGKLLESDLWYFYHFERRKISFFSHCFYFICSTVSVNVPAKNWI